MHRQKKKGCSEHMKPVSKSVADMSIEEFAAELKRLNDVTLGVPQYPHHNRGRNMKAVGVGSNSTRLTMQRQRAKRKNPWKK